MVGALPRAFFRFAGSRVKPGMTDYFGIANG